jgi:hydroxymethylglutaryl-CoA lyase
MDIPSSTKSHKPSRFLGNTPSFIKVRDTTLRDGLQSVSTVLSTRSKVAIYDALVAAGLRELQITSFVNPSRVPQLSDAETLCAALSQRPERRSVLVANMRGFDRAVAAGATEIEAIVSISEDYNKKNSHRTVRQSVDEIKAMAELAPRNGCTLAVGLANCYHCVFRGRIESGAVLTIIDELAQCGITQIGLSDTTGYATPDHVYDLSQIALATFPQITFGAHLHDTRGRGMCNAIASLSAGITWFDAALAGLGGSPFAPGMGGNLSIETLTDSLSAMDIETGIDVQRVRDVGALVGTTIDKSSRRVIEYS